MSSLSQIKSDTVQSAYQLLIDAAIILYFIPFLYMFAGVIRLANRGRRSEEKNAVLIPGGMTGVWICGAVGFLVVLVGIAVSAIPPGDEKNVWLFEAKLIIGTVVSVLIGLVLYWRGVRRKSKDVA